ncbi:hypothetical protein K402DRAFT_242987 [Aulographum hederae CBS 113979]|uniref:Uncharacterized protein n=1 Tax=Aulographum hederae CBS 113979 TaxID=1176131 RepID=A0A6G1HAD4_9PEZI|nr:hypothetical protein K402DRAFT_242987 [Aulographum hederae CBS 113979]
MKVVHVQFFLACECWLRIRCRTFSYPLRGQSARQSPQLFLASLITVRCTVRFFSGAAPALSLPPPSPCLQPCRRKSPLSAKGRVWVLVDSQRLRNGYPCTVSSWPRDSAYYHHTYRLVFTPSSSTLRKTPSPPSSELPGALSPSMLEQHRLASPSMLIRPLLLTGSPP